MPAFAPSRTIRLSPAYDGPGERREALWDLVVTNAPYPLMMALAGYDMDAGDFAAMPWFRRYWALEGQVLVPEAAPFFHSTRFLDAAREVSGSGHVRPARMMVNLMGPMAPGVAHLDTPTFRATGPVPLWMKLVMGASGLFERWWVPVCGAVSWFYDGGAGEYEYWPDGPGAPSRAETAPFGNVAVLADNDRMFHRVGAVAPHAARLAPGSVSGRAELHRTGGGPPAGWRIVDGDTVTELAPDTVRVSILWAALCFPDAAAEARFEDHTDDLTVEHITDVFHVDLTRRGVPHEVPVDPATDDAWIRLLNREYPIPTFSPRE